MPNQNAEPRTQEALEKSIKDTTARIGRAKRGEDPVALNRARRWRNRTMIELAERFNRWTLINEEGKTEFVDRAEWEQRQVAYARRNGVIPRGNVNLSSARPPAPPAAPGATPPAPPVAPPPSAGTPPAPPAGRSLDEIVDEDGA